MCFEYSNDGIRSLGTKVCPCDRSLQPTSHAFRLEYLLRNTRLGLGSLLGTTWWRGLCNPHSRDIMRVILRSCLLFKSLTRIGSPQRRRRSHLRVVRRLRTDTEHVLLHCSLTHHHRRHHLFTQGPLDSVFDHPMRPESASNRGPPGRFGRLNLRRYAPVKACHVISRSGLYVSWDMVCTFDPWC